ncbi:MAG: DUF6206 family protein [Anaerolineae bacterium]
MRGTAVDIHFLQQFEAGLDPRRPEQSAIPARVLGYGEISTVIAIDRLGQEHLAFKRMPMFRNEDEISQYVGLYEEYVRVLQEEIGVRVAAGEMVRLPQTHAGHLVVYLVQERFPAGAIGNAVIHRLDPEERRQLVLAVLRELQKVFTFNRRHRGVLELGIDGQISNWAVMPFDEAAGRPAGPFHLVYLDTTTPLLSRNGVEQLNPELFLRSAPSFLVWLLRMLFLQDVMTRYYDFRKVIIDLIANFYKEQLPAMVPALVETANAFLAGEAAEFEIPPLTVQEIHSYYREDAWIWRLYLAFRKVDRELHQLMGRHYPYILPAAIRR